MNINDEIARVRRLEVFDKGERINIWFIEPLRERLEERIANLSEARLTEPFDKIELVRRIVDTLISEAWANPCLPDGVRVAFRRLVVPMHDWLNVMALRLDRPSLAPPPLPFETSMARDRGM